MRPEPRHRPLRSILAASSIALTAAVSGPAFAWPSFTPLGDLPGGSAHSEAWGVSADGSTVVGASIISGNIIFGGTYAAFRWTASTGLVDIYNLGGIGTICRGYGVNAEGSVVVGMADYGVMSSTGIVAFIWSEATGVIEIGDLPGGTYASLSAARGISADAAIIAGQGESEFGPEPFRFTTADFTFFGLGDLKGGAFGGSAFGISADGTTIVGSSVSTDGTQAFRWTESEGIVPLGYLPTVEGVVPFSEAYAASADGSVVVGLSRSLASAQAGWEAFRWTAEGGMEGLGDLPGGAVLSSAFATTANGQIIVGRAGVLGFCSPFGCQTDGRAFIWDAQHGLRDLTIVLTDLGIDLTGWELIEARGISANGQFIVGTGFNPAGEVEAWHADIGPPPVFGDINGDGDVNVEDLLAIISAWGPCPPIFPPDCPPDLNGDVIVNVADLLLVISNWS
ncbi:MAG: hypothetical protein L0219_14345 [Phycisphaerales bacterium]|nr:hypothetical protein [Phycisphaerales bacterium]